LLQCDKLLLPVLRNRRTEVQAVTGPKNNKPAEQDHAHSPGSLQSTVENRRFEFVWHQHRVG
jgi:hypothetical protein